jgi:hypothetical protein
MKMKYFILLLIPLIIISLSLFPLFINSNLYFYILNKKLFNFNELNKIKQKNVGINFNKGFRFFVVI